ncbi:MAG TPA: DUF3365 domain-containing protein [Dissulfurispiraceae bacterium]
METLEESKTGRSTSPSRLALLFLVPPLVALAAMFSLLLFWEHKKIEEDEISELREVGRAFFDQIMVTRTWNARHGGLYAEVSPDTPPNPNLGNDPHRDIVSTDGRRYTKISPAYMTRQLSEIADKTHGYKFRIVSLIPVNPYNLADEWEQSALREFEKGKAEAGAIYENRRDKRREFKYIVPVKIEDPCAKCHAKDGFQHGEVRGGIIITIPMTQYDRIQEMKFRRTMISLLVTGTVSILFIAAITVYLSRRLSLEIEKNIEQKKLAAAIELAGATAHEMRQPMTILQSLASLIGTKLKQQEAVTKEELEIIGDQCGRMNDIIRKMLSITSYKTKEYVRGKNIVDLHESSRPEDSKDKE